MQAELGGAISQSIYYVPNIKGGANTVTVTFNQSAASPDIRVLEYSGLNTASPLDATAVGSGNGTAASSGSASTTSANELIFGANTVYTGTRSAGTGFTSRTITSDGDIAEDEAGGPPFAVCAKGGRGSRNLSGGSYLQFNPRPLVDLQPSRFSVGILAVTAPAP